MLVPLPLLSERLTGSIIMQTYKKDAKELAVRAPDAKERPRVVKRVQERRVSLALTVGNTPAASCI